jgi:hypothetical protein
MEILYLLVFEEEDVPIFIVFISFQHFLSFQLWSRAMPVSTHCHKYYGLCPTKIHLVDKDIFNLLFFKEEDVPTFPYFSHFSKIFQAFGFGP